jgi:signal transduction histidine kinase
LDARGALDRIFKGETVHTEHPVYNYLGKYVFGSFVYVPHFSENGNVKAYLVMIQDITENKKQQEELISAKEKAEKSDKLKTEFLAQMSHEIRTPINAILSFTSLIREQVAGKLDSELADSFTIINKAGERIIRTIQLILDMSQLQTGAYEPVLRRQDIYSDILVKLFVEHKENAKEKNLEFLLRKETNDSEVLGDEYTLRQIYGNLIDNAIKYTFKGRVEVVVWRDEESKLAISIRDTGIGISKEYMDDLFQPFTQEEMGYTRKFEGNGLGLAIVKKFCEVNKAHLYVQSEKGKGSCFTTIFPQN